MFIRCGSDCVHQADGYCGLETASAVASVNTECAFYQKKQKNPPVKQKPEETKNAERF